MRRNRLSLLLLGCALLLAALSLTVPALAQDSTEEPTQEPLDSPFAGSPDLHAPDFPAGLDWINVSAPVTMNDLRGKIVVLDFWTYGCINCIHMIPVLQQLEQKYGDVLQVIGVHSAKFANEGDTTNIRQIVQRYELHHPVINDNQFIVWQTYGVQAWPTFVVIDPRGNVLARQAGEIPFDAFDRLLSQMETFWDGIGGLNHEPLPMTLEGAGTPPGLLAFPGKVLADADSGRLFIADSNHHRIIVADLNTFAVQDVIGTGTPGLDDGGFDAATFNKPQGMALREDVLYVADTENHAIRAVDLAARTVTTVAGNGYQMMMRADFGVQTPGASTLLSSPWDVAFGDDGILYIAMAGIHQIWAMYPGEAHPVAPVIGSGGEGAVSSTLADSQLAQPSGLFFANGLLFSTDPESSTVRESDIAAGTVTTIAGTPDNNLFDFGDVDGAEGTSRLQHALGITGDNDGHLYIADTYNSRIKEIDLATDTTTTLAGSGGDGGFRDGVGQDAAFDEPGGLSYANGKLYVADTNNQAIRVIDLASDTVSTVTFPNPDRLQIAGQTTVVGGNAASGETLTLDAQTVAPGDGEIVVTLALPDGYKVNADAPSQVSFASDGEAVTVSADAVPFHDTEIHIPVTLSAGEAAVSGTITTYYCEAVNETLCFFDEVGVSIPVTVADGAASGAITVERAITPPEITVGTVS